MTFDHLALVIGIIALALTFASVYGFPLVRPRLPDNKKLQWDKTLEKLDSLHFLATLWTVSGVGIVVWLVSRVVISYA